VLRQADGTQKQSSSAMQKLPEFGRLMQYDRAMEIAESLCDRLQPYCDKIEIGGSLRRGKSHVKDIEIICIRKTAVLSSFIGEIAKLGNPSKGQPLGKYMQISLKDHPIKLDLFMCYPDNWGLIYFIRTGSAVFVRNTMIELQSNNWHCRGGYMYRTEQPQKKVVTVTEKEVFERAGISYLHPKDRS
jgi:DNA polymerase/3'-5' exonuclease PolX